MRKKTFFMRVEPKPGLYKTLSLKAKSSECAAREAVNKYGVISADVYKVETDFYKGRQPMLSFPPMQTEYHSVRAFREAQAQMARLERMVARRMMHIELGHIPEHVVSMPQPTYEFLTW